LLGGLLVLVLLCLIALSSHRQAQEALDQADWVSHSHDVLNAINLCQQLVDRCEAQERFYCATGDDVALSRYRAFSTETKNLIERLKELVRDNNHQEAHAANIALLIDKEIRNCDRLISEKIDDPPHHFGKVEIELPRQFVGKIDEEFARMRMEEKYLLVTRTANLRAASKNTLFGQLVLLLVSLALLLGAYLAVCRHMDAQDQHQKLLNASRRRFAGIFNQAFQMVWVLDNDGNLIQANQPALNLSGLDKEIDVGKPFWETIWWLESSEKESSSLRVALQNAAQGVIQRLQIGTHNNQGDPIQLDLSIKQIADESGNLSLILVSGRDVTESRLAQAQLRQKQVQLDAIIKSLGEGLYQLNLEGSIVLINEAGCRILNYEPEELIGQKAHEFLHVMDNPDQECPILQVMKDGVTQRLEETFRRKGGSQFPTQVVSSPLIMDGEIKGAVVSFVDISEKKEVEKRVSEFYSTVSHELRTPLTSIRASLGLLEGGLAGELSEKGAKLVVIARSECERLIRLINDILDIRKIEAGKLELNLQRLKVSKIVERAVEATAGMALQFAVHVRSDIDASDDECTGDQDRLIQVVTNLISNAIKFSPTGGEVTVGVATAENTVCFSVADHGPGIPKELRPKLFGQFQQLDSSDSRSRGGTGLGLAISKAIVESHGGRIDVESVPGEGSKFFFTLPVLHHTKHDEDNNLPGSQILIIEDDVQLAIVLKHVLESENYSVQIAHSIQGAEEILTKSSPRAIILDIGLPDGNGLAWFRKMQEKRGQETIPAVVLTGCEPENGSYPVPLLVDWLKKPVDIPKLLSVINQVVVGSQLREAKVLIVEDDQSTRQVLKHQLTEMGIKTFEASSGLKALNMVQEEKPDLIILDLGLPGMDGFEVVKHLQEDSGASTSLLVYTSRDLSHEDMEKLRLGLTKHLIKSKTSQEEFLSTVKELLTTAMKEK